MANYLDNTLLIVDDNEDICEYFETIFEDIVQRVYMANSGEKALKIIEKYNIDMVISDLNMPGMGGFELISKVREIDPIIVSMVLTGDIEMDVFREAVQHHVFDFLEKPFKEENLIERVKHGLDVFNERRILNILAREAVLGFYEFKKESDFDDLDEEEKKELMNRIIALYSEKSTKKNNSW